MGRRTGKLKKAIVGWLESEKTGSERQAERELSRVFELLPTPGPSGLFVERTLARLGAFSRPKASTGWIYRMTVGLSLVLASLALTLVPEVLVAALQTVNPASLVDWGAGLIVVVVQRLAQGVTVWGVFARVGEGVAAALVSPTAFASLLLALTISFAAFRALTGLLAPQGRTSHV